MGYIYTKSGKLAKRLYFGAVLLFEGLYYTFKNRVLADGGTFVENELPTISQDASLVLTPNAYKAGKLYSAVPNDGTGDFIVERDSEATYTGQDGTRRTALANEIRLDWSTGEAALLVEPQSTNLITYSENLVGWRQRNVTSSQNLVTEDTSNTLHAVSQNLTLQPDTTLTLSFDIKPNGRDYVYVRYAGGGFEHSFNLDILNGLVVSFDHFLSVTLKPIQNGYYRVNSTTIVPSSTTSTTLYLFLSDSGDYLSRRNPIYIGDGVSGAYISNVQLEQGTEATSYIPTNGVTETRLADNISLPTLAGVTSITETIDGVEQTPITTIPTTYSLPVGNINKVTML